MVNLAFAQHQNQEPEFIREARQWIFEHGGFERAVKSGEPALPIVLAHLWDSTTNARGTIMEMAPALAGKL
jgi:hypothetical protein